MAQHPFTPEPREPEPWPGPREVPSAWVWDAESDTVHTEPGGALVILDADELKAMAKHERAQRKRYKARGFSVGFGTYP